MPANHVSVLGCPLALLELLDEVSEGGEVLLLDEFELVDEVDEMLEAGVEVVLEAEADDVGEVGVVDVRVDPEQALEDGLDLLQEVLGEGHAHHAGEEGLVVELGLGPRHQEVDVLGGRDLEGRADGRVRPVVLVLGPARHDAAGLLRAGLGQRPVQDRDLVVELDYVHRQPLVQVLPRRQLHRQAHVPRAQRHLRDVTQLVPLRPLVDRPQRLERLQLVLLHSTTINPKSK
jgi:hypothetical protein